jgi:hypothetical protein
MVTKIMSFKEGHAVYFASVIAAVPLFIISTSFYAALVANDIGLELVTAFSSLIEKFFGSVEQKNSEVLSVAILSMPLAAIFAYIANVPIYRNSRLSRYFYEEIGDGEPLESVLSEAMENELPILVSLTSGKVYLGYSLVTELYGQSSSQWLHLAPWLSGHRDETQRLKFTTAYAPVAWRRDQERLVHDPRFQLAIPLSAVCSVTPFDMEVYRNHFSVDGSRETTQDDASSLAQEEKVDWRLSAKRDAYLYGTGLFLIGIGMLVMNVSFFPAFFFMFVGVAIAGIPCFPKESE